MFDIIPILVMNLVFLFDEVCNQITFDFDSCFVCNFTFVRKKMIDKLKSCVRCVIDFNATALQIKGSACSLNKLTH